jgi:tRNA1Val (adenine37-N6)-methyltransferase
MAFRFKQFEINQENAPFKIGTDGLLLGAWTKHEQPKHILDIGTGTGLIALMMAQRFPTSEVEAIELNSEAVEIARSNFENSPWKSRLNLQNGDFKSQPFSRKFDLIISNPPFFSGSKLSKKGGKNIARHTIELTLNDLLKKSSTLLSNTGVLGIVLPFELKEEALIIGSSYDLFPKRICNVLPTPKSTPKRILIEFTAFVSALEESELIIEEFGRHQYSKAYKNLVQDFLLDK